MCNIIGILVIIIILILLYYFLKNKSLDNFIVFVDDVVIPKSCWEYLVTNGEDYFLFNSKMLVDGIKNPLKFSSKQLALNYLESNKCPTNIPFIDLVNRKKKDDPTVSMQRQCNVKTAITNFDADTCNFYNNNEEYNKKKIVNNNLTLTELKNKQKERKVYTNYNTEQCMIENAINDNPDLDDASFNTNFKAYFNRLNTNIDESFLYINY